MEEITLAMGMNENSRKHVTQEWIQIFNECIEVQSEEAGRPEAEDLQTVMGSERQEWEIPCRYCGKPVSMRQRIYFSKKSAVCEECRAEALFSQGDAEKVIESCLYVLNDIYGLGITVPVFIKMRRKIRDLVKIEGIRPSAKKREQRKGAGKHGNHKNCGKVKILCNAPRFYVMSAFVNECFRSRLEKKPTLNGTVRKEGDISAEGRMQESNRLFVWLTANFLYTIGEFDYAEQYISDYQVQGNKESMEELFAQIGSPWSVSGSSAMDIVRTIFSNEERSTQIMVEQLF